MQLADGDAPVGDLEEQRQSALEQRVVADNALAAARSALEAIEHELRGFEQTRQQRDAHALAQREAISQRRLDQQALVIRADQLRAAVVEAGYEMEAVLANVADEASAPAWEKMVADFDARLRRLEPVNLAAIQEHAEAAQRKEYLDSQDADLNSALETLEDAIRKIDRETRGRFKDTFDKVNAGVQALYPRLFGGGHAYLELTGDDLLDTGVAIMARPPGKRVSNISLLSGGEKARLVMALLEPQAPDALAAWGAFNNHFERKEYMEAYVAEAVAREMLEADPAVREAFERLLPQLKGAPLVTVSARTGKGLDRLHNAILKAHEVWNRRISTARLNQWLGAMIESHPPPAPGGRRIRLRYMTQVKTRPPAFVVKATHTDKLPDSYQRYLVNGLRQDFDMPGTPIRLFFRDQGTDNPYKEKANKISQSGALSKHKNRQKPKDA